MLFPVVPILKVSFPSRASEPGAARGFVELLLLPPVDGCRAMFAVLYKLCSRHIGCSPTLHFNLREWWHSRSLAE